MSNKYQCQGCRNEFNMSEMADWTICFSCMQREHENMGYVYTDSLGIGYTQEDLNQVGGIEEIEKLCRESKFNIS